MGNVLKVVFGSHHFGPYGLATSGERPTYRKREPKDNNRFLTELERYVDLLNAIEDTEDRESPELSPRELASPPQQTHVANHQLSGSEYTRFNRRIVPTFSVGDVNDGSGQGVNTPSVLKGLVQSDLPGALPSEDALPTGVTRAAPNVGDLQQSTVTPSPASVPPSKAYTDAAASTAKPHVQAANTVHISTGFVPQPTSKSSPKRLSSSPNSTSRFPPKPPLSDKRGTRRPDGVGSTPTPGMPVVFGKLPAQVDLAGINGNVHRNVMRPHTVPRSRDTRHHVGMGDTTMIILCVLGGVTVLLFILAFVYRQWRKRGQNDASRREWDKFSKGLEDKKLDRRFELLRLKYDLSASTKGYAQATKKEGVIRWPQENICVPSVSVHAVTESSFSPHYPRQSLGTMTTNSTRMVVSSSCNDTSVTQRHANLSRRQQCLSSVEGFELVDNVLIRANPSTSGFAQRDTMANSRKPCPKPRKPHSGGVASSAGSEPLLEAASISDPSVETPGGYELIDKDAIFGSTSHRSSSLENLSFDATDRKPRSGGAAMTTMAGSRSRGYSVGAGAGYVGIRTRHNDNWEKGEPEKKCDTAKPSNSTGLPTAPTTSEATDMKPGTRGFPQKPDFSGEMSEIQQPLVPQVIDIDGNSHVAEGVEIAQSSSRPPLDRQKRYSSPSASFEIVDDGLLMNAGVAKPQVQSNSSISQTFATISPTESKALQSHSPLGTIHFCIQYQMDAECLVVGILRAENLSLDRDRRPPNSMVKIELKPPNSGDTAVAETRVINSDRHPLYKEEVVFNSYAHAEVKRCVLNLKVYNCRERPGVIKHSRTRLGVVRFSLALINLTAVTTYSRPLEKSRQRQT